MILTPPDSPDLLCLDLTTGKPVWPAQRRDDLLFVAGVHDGTVVLVSQEHHLADAFEFTVYRRGPGDDAK